MKSADVVQAEKPPRKKNIHPAVSSHHRGKPCAVKGCSIRTLTPTTEYCAAHFQSLVGKPGLKQWLKQRRPRST